MNEGRKLREREIYEKLSGRGSWDYYMWDRELMHNLHRDLGLWYRKMCRRYLSNRRVLVLGCGSSGGIESLKQYASAIVGIDISPRRLKEARSKFSEPNIIFVEGDAENLPFPNGTFDVVYCHAILHHLDLPKALMETRRVLVPKGYLYVAAEPGLLNPIAWLRRTFFPSHIHTPDEKPFIPHRFRKIVHLYGFREIDYQPSFIFSPVVPVLGKKFSRVQWKPLLNFLLSLDRFLLKTPCRELSWVIAGVYSLCPSTAKTHHSITGAQVLT